MSAPQYWKRGDWKAVCDRCGESYKASQLLLEWDGLRVCRYCWEPRNAQDFIKAIPERKIPWSRPPQPMPGQGQTIMQWVDGNFVDQTWVG